MERWRINLYSVWFTQIISIMSFNLGMPFMVYYIQEMGMHDPAQIKLYAGILSAGPAITLGLMAPVWGRLADRFGKKIMLLRAVMFGSVIMLGLGMATQVWQLVVLRMIQGVFTGTITASSALVASTVPENKMGYSLGFLASSTAIGGSVGPALGGLMAEWLGYRYSFLLGGFLLFLDVLVVLFLIRDPAEQKPQTIASSSVNPAIVPARLKDSFVFSSWFIASMLLLLVLRFATSVFGPYMPILIQQKMNSLEGAAGITGLVNAFISVMMAISGIFLGKLGDRYDRMKLLRWYAIAGFLLAIPLSLHSSIWMLMVNYGVMMFFVCGIEPVLMGATTSRIRRDQRGTMFGVQTLVGSIGWGLSPMLGGYISIRHSIPAVLLAIPAFLFVEILLAGTIGRRLSGRSPLESSAPGAKPAA